MKQCIVVGNTTYADGCASLAAINSLVDGAIAIFNTNGTLVTVPADLSTDEVIVGLGRTLGGSKLITPVTRYGLDYIAPVATPAAAVNKVMYAGDDGTGAYTGLTVPAVVTGMWVALIVEDLEKHPADTTRTRRYAYSLKLTDNSTTVAVAVRALVTDDDYRIINVADCGGADEGIQCTGITAGHNFAIQVQGEWAGQDIIDYQLVNQVYTVGEVHPVAISHGVGTAEQVAVFELESLQEDGMTSTYRPEPGMNSIVPRAVAGTVYHIYTIKYGANRKGGNAIHRPDIQILRICVSNAGGYAALRAALNLVFAAL